MLETDQLNFRRLAIVAVFPQFTQPIPALLYLTSHLAVAIVTDLRGGRIPDRLVASLAAGGVATSLWDSDVHALLQSLFGGALAFVVLLGLSLMFSGAIGGGDIKLMAASGLYLGPAATFHALVWTFVVGGVMSLLMLSLGVAKLRDTIPYAPAIALGVLLSVFTAS